MKSFYDKLADASPRIKKALERVRQENIDPIDLSGEVDFARVQLSTAVDNLEEMLNKTEPDKHMGILSLGQVEINAALDRIARIAEKAAKIRIVSSTYLSVEQQEEVLRQVINAVSRVFNSDQDKVKLERAIKEIEEISVFSKKDIRGNVTITL